MSNDKLPFEISRVQKHGFFEMKFLIPVTVNVTFTDGKTDSFLASHILYKDFEELELSTPDDCFFCSSELVEMLEIVSGNKGLRLKIVYRE